MVNKGKTINLLITFSKFKYIHECYSKIIFPRSSPTYLAKKKAIGEETRETAAVEDTPKMAEGVIDSLLYSGLSTADLLVRS